MNGVIIVAAGSGSRMNMGINKQFIKLEEKEIIAYTIEKFYNNKNIDEIVIVTKEEEREYLIKNILKKYKFDNIKVVTGGKERQDSVYSGLMALSKKCSTVLVHDGARPFVTDEVIDRTIKEIDLSEAIVVGVPVKDTIKVINNENTIIDTPNRDTLWAVQTPQVFKYDVLKEAYDDAFKNNFYGTDDAMLVERIGYNVKMIKGSYNNIKITTVEDLSIGLQILKTQNN